MHTDQFERDVQAKMNGLKMTPSAPVWAEVEARIRAERRKRRVLIFWLLPLLLLLGAGGWWLLRQPEAGPNHTPLATAPGRTDTAKTIRRIRTLGRANDTTRIETVHAGRHDEAGVSAIITDSAPGQPGLPDAAKAENRKSVLARIFGRHKSPANVSTAAASITSKKKERSAGNESDARYEPSENTTTNAIAPASTGSTVPGAAKAVTQTQQPTGLSTDSVVKNALAKTPVATDSTQSSAVATPKPQAGKRRLQWQLEGGADAVQASRAGNSLSASALLAAGATDTMEHTWRNGRAFNIGIHFQLPVTQRLRFRAGIEYTVFQLVQERTVSYGVSIGGVTPFTGPATRKAEARIQLAYVQVPVGLEWRPSARRSFSVLGGLSAGHLLSAGSHDNVEKISLSLQLGARFRLARIGSHSLELGPQLSTGLRPLEGNQRLLQAGARLRFSF